MDKKPSLRNHIKRYLPINLKVQPFFLSCLGLIHLLAFWSYYVQYPGLLSSAGIEPVHRLIPHAAPSLYKRLIQSEVMDEDTLCELVCIMGMFVGAVLSSGICQHGLLFCLQTAMYSFLVRVGGTFYSFQWDTLLLETTIVTALTYAPWSAMKPKKETSSSTFIISPWPLRLLLFKLMYMSGVVKVQAHCPTWTTYLTALEYHFATQCLPGPLAWHVHQFHPFLLRLGVAMTLWIELPVTLLLIMPHPVPAYIGAMLQLLLQCLILLTGNYNFFNLLTMALCLPVIHQSESNKNYTNRSSILSMILHFAIWICLAIWTFRSMFTISVHPDDSRLAIKFILSSSKLDQYTNVILPVIIIGVMVWVLMLTMMSCTNRSQSTIRTLVHGLVCCMVLCCIAWPMTSLTPTLQIQSRNISTWNSVDMVVNPWYNTFIRPYHLFNGYGLFRRMTGVGTTATSMSTKGWAGVPPSVVARPEIILEGLIVRKNDNNNNNNNSHEEWKELSFRWKPGTLEELPHQVAPHQPRLDWQMWFAALGRLNQNPWLIHLVYKIMHDCEPVMSLLGRQKMSLSSMNDNDDDTGFQIQQIRAKLYHYDFTRIDTEWSTMIPGVDILPCANCSFWSQLFVMKPNKVWNRTLIQEHYMSPLEQDHPSLVQYLSAHYGERYASCPSPRARCFHHASLWCWIAITIREKHLYLLIPLGLLIAMFSFGLIGNVISQVKRQSGQAPGSITREKKEQ